MQTDASGRLEKKLIEAMENYTQIYTDAQMRHRQGPRLSIRIVIWILPSDTETSAGTPCERVQKM